MSLKNKLSRMRPHLNNDEGKQLPKQAELPQNSIKEIPFLEEWKKERVFPYYYNNEYCLLREVTYPLSHIHGNYSFERLYEVIEAWNRENLIHPLSGAGHKAEDLFFFDTETTGLGGGAGNTIFLLGHANITKNHVKVKQHILPHPGAEIPFYQSFLESIDYTTLVTYNGKAFDWPQVQTRHTLIREHVPKLPQFGHFDLYHAARRMWKHRLERVKLTAVETNILGFERKDDIPGFLAPMIYFDFLESKNPVGLMGILKHNELDILSLITLYIHLSIQLLGLDHKQTSKETYEVGRWYSSLGQTTAAKAAFSKVVDEKKSDSILALHALAYECKKSHDWEQALIYWQEVVDKGELLIMGEACVELAKIYEHKKKDIQAGLKYSLIAQERYRNHFKQMETPFLLELRKRINRLENKQRKLQTLKNPL
jgi:uncharacterized protein